MKKHLIALAALIALLVVAPASSEGVGVFFKGTIMMTLCKLESDAASKGEAWKFGECAYYLAGIADTQTILAADDLVRERLVCFPVGVNQPQLRQVFLNYMNAHPENWHFPAASLALNSFIQAWPCKE